MPNKNKFMTNKKYSLDRVWKQLKPSTTTLDDALHAFKKNNDIPCNTLDWNDQTQILSSLILPLMQCCSASAAVVAAVVAEIDREEHVLIVDSAAVIATDVVETSENL